MTPDEVSACGTAVDTEQPLPFPWAQHLDKQVGLPTHYRASVVEAPPPHLWYCLYCPAVGLIEEAMVVSLKEPEIAARSDVGPPTSEVESFTFGMGVMRARRARRTSERKRTKDVGSVERLRERGREGDKSSKP